MTQLTSMEQMPNEISWLFELEDDGTVLHSSCRSGNASGLMFDTVGRNFFDSTFEFDDISAFQRHFKTFIKSQKAAERLTWKCSFGQNTFDAKISMTRAFQTGYYRPSGIVMLEIKN